MSISIGTFRKNVMKTVLSKPAKMGLRTTLKNTARTNTAHAIVSLKRSIGNLLQSQESYLLGSQITPEIKEKARFYLGEVGANLVVVCRFLKLKTPSASAKKKLVGTRGSALLHMDSLATDLLFYAEQGLFSQPRMKTISKSVTNPQKGTQEVRQVEVVDTESEAEAQKTVMASMTNLVQGIVDLYWPLCTDIIGEGPAVVMSEKLKRLMDEHPTIEWSLEKAKENSTAPEAVAPTPTVSATGTATALAKPKKKTA